MKKFLALAILMLASVFVSADPLPAGTYHIPFPVNAVNSNGTITANSQLFDANNNLVGTLHFAATVDGSTFSGWIKIDQNSVQTDYFNDYVGNFSGPTSNGSGNGLFTGGSMSFTTETVRVVTAHVPHMQFRVSSATLTIN